MSFIKPGHTSLNMEDISEDLQVVHHHVTKLDIDKRIDNSIDKATKPEFYDLMMKADDVDLVAKVPANQIAVAINENDRTTVNNAVHLDGKDISFFMTNSAGSGLSSTVNSIETNFGKDISDIRNELYEIKHALEKQGLITNTYQRMGYNDVFRNGYKPYTYEIIGEITDSCPNYKTLYLTMDATEKLDDNDFIAIYFIDSKHVDIRQIQKIEADKETVILDESMDTSQNIKKGNVVVYKTMGVSRDGNFYFARDAESVPGDTKIYTGFDDDTAADSLLLINKNNIGYANTFRIPQAKKGYLHDFSVMAEVKGTPTLVCYIIDQQDIKNFKNPAQAEALYKSGDTDSTGEPKMHFFAKSNPVTLSTMAETLVTFDFYNSEIDSYPLIARLDNAAKNIVVRYSAIICAQFADEDNSVKLYAVYNRDNNNTPYDIETRNKLYKYYEQSEISTNSAYFDQTYITSLSPVITAQAREREELQVQSYDEFLDKYDIYYEVGLREKVTNQMIPYERGLYTANIKCSYPEGISRARLMLRFNREGGCWNADIVNPSIYGGNTSNGNFPVKCVSHDTFTKASYLNLNSKIRKPIELRDTEVLSDIWTQSDMIAGNNIVNGSSSDTVAIPETPVMIYPKDMVYRNGYIVSVKGKRYEYDEGLQKFVVQDKQKIYLKPVAVIRDGVKHKDDVYSDRVIFEGDFLDESGNAAFFNQLELQIYWEESNFSDVQAVKQTQMGIIHDLVFSTDRAVAAASNASGSTQQSLYDRISYLESDMNATIEKFKELKDNIADIADSSTDIDLIKQEVEDKVNILQAEVSDNINQFKENVNYELTSIKKKHKLVYEEFDWNSISDDYTKVLRLSKTPNPTVVKMYVNNITYFENESFTVNRLEKTVQWIDNDFDVSNVDIIKLEYYVDEE